MYLYSINDFKLKSKQYQDVSLFAIYPPTLKLLSLYHFKAYNWTPEYKLYNVFKIASKYADIKIIKIDGRKKEYRHLDYISVNHLFIILKDNADFKAEILKALNCK